MLVSNPAFITVSSHILPQFLAALLRGFVEHWCFYPGRRQQITHQSHVPDHPAGSIWSVHCLCPLTVSFLYQISALFTFLISCYDIVH